MIQHIGSAISCTPLFNDNSFSKVFSYICKDNKIKNFDIYTSLYMNNKTFYNHINNTSNSKAVTIDICIASGFDLVLTLILLSLKGFILNPNDENDYKIMDFIHNYEGTAEERIDEYIDLFKPELLD